MMPATTVQEKLPKTPSPGGKITKVKTFTEDDSEDEEETTQYSASDQEAEPEVDSRVSGEDAEVAAADVPLSTPKKNSAAKRKDSTHLFQAGDNGHTADSHSSKTKKKKGKGKDLSEKYNTSVAARNEKKSAWQSMKSIGTEVKRDFRSLAKKINPKRTRNEVKEISITQDRHEDVDVCWSEKRGKCATDDQLKDITPTNSARSRASDDITVVHDLEDDHIY